MIAKRIPAALVENAQSWQMPELSGETSLYVAEERDGKAADLPKLQSGKKPQYLNTADKTQRHKISGKELDELVKKATEEGYQAGLEEGKSKGHAEGLETGISDSATQVDVAMAAITTMEEKLPDALNAHNQQERDLMILLIGKVARAVIHEELRDDAANITRIIDHALKSVDSSDKALRVHVSEQDATLLNDHQKGRDWQLVVDESLKNGDCLVETKFAMLDYSVEQRLDEALTTLSNNLRNASDET